jgi:hypothetical protein
MSAPDPGESPPATGPAETDRRAALDAIRADDSKWAPSETADFSGVRWQPDLVRDGGVLHLGLTSEVPNAWMRRMEAAASVGSDVTFATTVLDLPIEALERLQRIDARIIWVDTERTPPRAARYRSIADLIATERLYLDPAGLRVLAGSRLREAVETTDSHPKGRWFEEALCLLFSQVSWLTVDKHAYRNSTEEIDLLMGCHAIGHVDRLVGGAVVVGTAKNEAKPTGSQTVKYLKEQMANRKGRCKLGFLCSASTISSDASEEIMRGSQSTDAVIVPLDRKTFESLLDDVDELDRRIEQLIVDAVAD